MESVMEYRVCTIRTGRNGGKFTVKSTATDSGLRSRDEAFRIAREILTRGEVRVLVERREHGVFQEVPQEEWDGRLSL